MTPPPPPGQGPVPPPPGYGYATYPPEGYGSPYAPAPRRSIARTLGVALLVAAVVCSVLLNVLLLFAVVAGAAVAGAGDGGRVETIVDGPAGSRVAVLPVEGLIDSAAADAFDRLADRVAADPTVKAIVIRIDTPGGEVTASDRIHHRVTQLKTDGNLPVVASMGAMATSGGYYVACAADNVYAQRTTITGNIGVLLPLYDLSGLAEKYGVSDATIVSTGTPFKDAGSMLKPTSPGQRDYLQGLIDSSFGTFKQVVTAGRGSRLTKPIDEVADGRAVDAVEAIALGLVDRQGYLEDAVAAAASSAGLAAGGYSAVRYRAPVGLLEAIGAASSTVGGARAKGPGAGDGVAELLRPLTDPRPLYLWRP